MHRKITTVFIISSLVFAGTALAAVLSTHPATKSMFFGSGPAVATTPANNTVHASALHAVLDATETAIAHDLASAISRALGLDIGSWDIDNLRGRNMGYGEITLAYNLAHASGRSIDDILEMRYEQKMGWGKIAKTLGVKLHDKANHSADILREVKLDNHADDFLSSLKIDLDEEDNDNKNHNKHAADSNNNNNNNNNNGNQDNGHGNPGNGNGHPGNGHGKH